MDEMVEVVLEDAIGAEEVISDQQQSELVRHLMSSSIETSNETVVTTSFVLSPADDNSTMKIERVDGTDNSSIDETPYLKDEPIDDDAYDDDDDDDDYIDNYNDDDDDDDDDEVDYLNDINYHRKRDNQSARKPVFTSNIIRHRRAPAKQTNKPLRCGNIPKAEFCKGTDEKLTCALCQKKFVTDFTLKRHMLGHKRENHVWCPKCSKSFIGDEYLAKHLRGCGKPKSCEVCGRQYALAGNLAQHMKSHRGYYMKIGRQVVSSTVAALDYDDGDDDNGDDDNGDDGDDEVEFSVSTTRPYSCEVCDERFERVYHLNKHMKSHKGRKGFKCRKCKHVFSSNMELKDHMMEHLEKPYPCKVCLKTFKSNGFLNRHMLTFHKKIARKGPKMIYGGGSK